MLVGCFIWKQSSFSACFDDYEPNTVKTDTNVETHDETTDSDDDFMSCCEFCQDYRGTSDIWTGNTMVRGQVQVNLIGNAGVAGLLWTLFQDVTWFSSGGGLDTGSSG